jgi:hypothetical protein
MNVTFRPARPTDAEAIVPRLRARDLEGLRTAGDPVEVVQCGLQFSIYSIAALADDEIAVLWGVRVCTLLDDRAYLWMLGTRVVDEHPIHMLRHSRAAVKIMRERYSLVYGEVACDFEKSIRWLTWLGAKIQAGPAADRMVFSL